MAYSFDGTDDEIDFGSDASIDDFTSRTACFWLVKDDTTADDFIIGKNAGGLQWDIRANDNIFCTQDFDTTNGTWSGGSVVTNAELIHFAVVYNRSDVANDPVIYKNSVSLTVTETLTPVGTSVADAARALRLGENGANNLDLAGDIGFVIYDSTLWTAEEVNRARWWGTRGGAVACYYPLLTDATNRGTATAAGTVTGAVLASLPRVERNWGMMMGCGR